jgi:hypothetical protein
MTGVYRLIPPREAVHWYKRGQAGVRLGRQACRRGRAFTSLEAHDGGKSGPR